MRRAVIVGAVIIGVLVVFVGLVWLRVSADRPERLIQKLRHAKGRKQEDLLVRLSLSRGDVMSHLSKAFRDSTEEPAFRADVLELLFKRSLRGTDASFEAVLGDALKDPADEVRRAAAKGLAQYGNESQQVALADCVGDPDPQVRRQAYMVFAASARRLRDGAHGELSDQQREDLANACASQMTNESDPDLAYLARAVVGREAEVRCSEADRAFGEGDIADARELLNSALELDPENEQVRVRLMRHYLLVDDRATALKLGRQYGALIEVPRLSEAPAIDGDPSEQVWQEGYTTGKFYHTTSRYVAKETSGKSRFYLGHRDGTIYLAMLGFEDDLSKLSVRHKGRDSDVWRDDCVELIFDPDATGKGCIQFVINAGGAVFDQQNGNRAKNFSFQHGAGIHHDRGYWAVELAISAEEMTGKPLSAESIWAGNFFRARIGPASEHGCIWPAYGSALKSEAYPLLVFKDVETAPGSEREDSREE